MDAGCPSTFQMAEWPAPGQVVRRGDEMWLVHGPAGGPLALTRLDATGRPVGEPRPLPDAIAGTVTLAGDLLVFGGADQIVGIGLTDGDLHFRAPLPATPGERTASVLVAPAPGGDGIAVVWERWNQRPDQGPGNLYGVAWYARLSPAGVWETDPVELPGREQREGANLTMATADSLVATSDALLVPWATWAFEDPSRVGELQLTTITRDQPVTTPLTPMRADSTSLAVGKRVRALAFTTVIDAKRGAAMLWVESRGEARVVTLRDEGTRPWVVLHEEGLYAAYDVAIEGKATVILVGVDPASGNLGREERLPVEDVVGRWQAGRGMWSTPCGVVVSYFDTSGPAHQTTWGAWFVPTGKLQRQLPMTTKGAQ
jgi:hypothetical protein